jgi:transposase
MNKRTFTNEFKQEAVRLMERGESTIVQIAKDLGVSDSTLHNWRKQFGTKSDGSRITLDEHEELIKLRRENRILKEEREILKKAAAYFAKEQF